MRRSAGNGWKILTASRTQQKGWRAIQRGHACRRGIADRLCETPWHVSERVERCPHRERRSPETVLDDLLIPSAPSFLRAEELPQHVTAAGGLRCCGDGGAGDLCGRAFHH